MERLVYKKPTTDIVRITENAAIMAVSGKMDDQTPIPPGGRVQGKENDIFGNGDVSPVNPWNQWED